MEESRLNSNPPSLTSLPVELRRMIIDAISAQCSPRERSNFLATNRTVYNQYQPILQLDDVVFRRYTMLRHFSMSGLTKSLQRYLEETGLLASGPLGELGRIPMAFAVRYGHPDCVRLLARHGAPVAGRVCALCFCRRRHRRFRSDFCPPQGCRVTHHGWWLIQLAQMCGKEMVACLLETAAECVGAGPAQPFDLSCLRNAVDFPDMADEADTMVQAAPWLPYGLHQRQRAVLHLFGYSVPRGSNPQPLSDYPKAI